MASTDRSTTTPRTKPADERRADLLDAGRAVFLDKGVAAATLDDVTRAAGVAKGTFYLYFRSKDDLLEALQDRFAEDFAAEMAAAIAAAPSWPGKLDAAIAACLTAYRSRLALHDVLFHHAGRGHDPADNQVVTTLQQLLAAGTAAGAYRVEDDRMTAVLLYSAIHQAFDAACHNPDEFDDRRLLTATEALFHRAAGC